MTRIVASELIELQLAIWLMTKQFGLIFLYDYWYKLTNFYLSLYLFVLENVIRNDKTKRLIFLNDYWYKLLILFVIVPVCFRNGGLSSKFVRSSVYFYFYNYISSHLSFLPFLILSTCSVRNETWREPSVLKSLPGNKLFITWMPWANKSGNKTHTLHAYELLAQSECPNKINSEVQFQQAW